VRTLVALGSGDPQTVPLASWRVLETAGRVEVAADDPLAEWLGRGGVMLEQGASVVAASGDRILERLAAEQWAETVPEGAAFDEVVRSTALQALWDLTVTLREQCPWDRQQTERTIVPHTLEEAYEVAEAANSGNDAKLVDELGDLLFQTYFLGLLLQERGAGDLAAIASSIRRKLIRRHPHVFGHHQANTPREVRSTWEKIKAEQEGREGIFHDVPGVLPSPLYARKVQRRASAVGFDWHAWDGAWSDLTDEISELREALDAAPPPKAESEADAHVRHEVGDLLFAAVNVSRLVNVDPELALRAAADRFRARVETAERLAADAGETWVTLDLEAQDEWYRKAKELRAPDEERASAE
jgi:XTP/dITP diphosphohydrolase/tetrapyrrole methylase family protein/MazG family protein/ATP diphosphatase